MNKVVDEILEGIYKFYGNTPSIGVVAENLKVSEEEATEVWSEWLASRKEPVKKKRPMKKRPTRKEESPKSKKPRKVIRKGHLMHDLAIMALPYGAGIIAILALVRSVMFSYAYFFRTEDIVVAWLMAGLLGLVILLGPSMLIYGIQMRKWAVVITAGVAVVIFGILNVYLTVEQLNYTKTQKEIAYTKTQEDILKGRARLPVIEAELAKNEENKRKDTAEYAILTSQSQVAFDAEDMPTFNRIRNNMATVQKRISEYELSDTKLKEERTAIQNLPEFYTAKVLTMEDRERSRQMDMLLGISLEMIGALMLSMAIFM